MYNNPYYMPIYNQPMNFAAPNLMRGMTATMPTATRGLATTAARAANTGGLFQRLGSSLSGIRAINWGGLINNTSKTLGIINQAIPVVRQVGPMVNNMKSMLRVASLFKDETDKQVTPTTNTRNNINKTKNTNTNNNITNNQNNKTKTLYTRSNINTENKINQSIKTTINTSKEEYSEAPTFFINN